MSIIHLRDCPATPWKNGMGRTRELAVHPAGAGMDDFIWRVSVAEVITAALALSHRMLRNSAPAETAEAWQTSC